MAYHRRTHWQTPLAYSIFTGILQDPVVMPERRQNSKDTSLELLKCDPGSGMGCTCFFRIAVQMAYASGVCQWVCLWYANGMPMGYANGVRRGVGLGARPGTAGTTRWVQRGWRKSLKRGAPEGGRWQLQPQLQRHTSGRPRYSPTIAQP